MSHFENPTKIPPTVDGLAITDNRQVLSVVFADLTARSDVADTARTVESAVLNIELPLQADRATVIRVEAKGAWLVEGDHSWVHAVIWVNGKRLALTEGESGDKDALYAVNRCAVQPGQPVRVSATLLAQRDLADAASHASVTLDALDFEILADSI